MKVICDCCKSVFNEEFICEDQKKKNNCPVCGAIDNIKVITTDDIIDAVYPALKEQFDFVPLYKANSIACHLASKLK